MQGHGHLPSLIAIHGKKRSGKGTISGYLERSYGYKLVKFADPLKDMLRVLLRYCNFDEDTIERCIESDLKEVSFDILGGKRPRELMQTLGTEWRMMVDSELWINIAIHRVRAHLARGERVAIDDLRFPNELVALRRENAAFWLVSNSRTADGGSTGAHVSEKGLPEEEFLEHLRNETSFEALYGQIETALRRYVTKAA